MSGAKIIVSLGIFHLRWHFFFFEVHFRVWVKVIFDRKSTVKFDPIWTAADKETHGQTLIFSLEEH